MITIWNFCKVDQLIKIINNYVSSLGSFFTVWTDKRSVLFKKVMVLILIKPFVIIIKIQDDRSVYMCLRYKILNMISKRLSELIFSISTRGNNKSK